jgi:hypothetical protein
MRRFPVIEGGRSVCTRDGKRGVVIDNSPEQAALSRWQTRQFLETERQFAKDWRQAITRIDLEQLFDVGRELIHSTRRPKDLVEAKDLAASILAKPGARYVATYLKSLDPDGLSRAAFRRWDTHGKPPITTYAPYTAHILLVDLFFTIALGADLAGRERPTNRIDMSYLYYLSFYPFVWCSPPATNSTRERLLCSWMRDRSFYTARTEIRPAKTGRVLRSITGGS